MRTLSYLLREAWANIWTNRTTTVVATLLDLATGTPAAVASLLNPQQPYGAEHEHRSHLGSSAAHEPEARFEPENRDRQRKEHGGDFDPTSSIRTGPDREERGRHEIERQ